MTTMYYITMKQQPWCHQMTLEELLFSSYVPPRRMTNQNTSGTRTYTSENISQKLSETINVDKLISELVSFNQMFECLHNVERETLYNTFYTAKKNKGMPHIFKSIYAMQHKYIGGDKSSVLSDISSKLRSLTSEHPTIKDKELSNEVFTYCTTRLIESGFEMTNDALKEIFKGGFRRIDAPNEDLKNALRCLKTIFESNFGALYHTSAFAYVEKRSTIDAMKKHQANQSKWFAKFDLSNFFGSTTVEFVMKMLSMIFPFCEVIKNPLGEAAIKEALSLCMLNGTLPQGTPISPLITNIMMIPVDHKLSNALRDFESQAFVYTRYADDFTISSKYNFDYKKIESFIVSVLKEFDAPFSINTDKTRYGSSAGSNWNLGLMLNKDNNITVGYRNKRRFQASLSSYVMDRANGNPWERRDIQELRGYYNYYKSVEGDVIDKIVEHIGKKFNTDILSLINDDLRG